MGFRSGCFHGKDLCFSSYGCWSPKLNLAGLQRCGQKCRLQWMNSLEPCLKRGIFKAPSAVKNRLSMKAKLLPGRTDRKIGKIWKSCVKKKQIGMGINQNNHTSDDPSIALLVREKIASYTVNNIEEPTDSVKEKEFQIERNDSFDLNILVDSAQDFSCYENWHGLHSQTERDATENLIWENLPAMIEEEEESGAPLLKMNKMGKS